jgi:hypothetical protein
MADIKAFNSEEFGFVDLTVIMLGRSVLGLRGLRFKVSQQKKNVRGAGRKPIARWRGAVEYEGSVTVLLSELIAMMQSQGVASSIGVVGIKPFDIVAAFAAQAGDTVTTFNLTYVEFMEYEVNVNQSDEEIEIELPIIIGEVLENV